MPTLDNTGLLVGIAHKVFRAAEGIDSLATEIGRAAPGKGYELRPYFDPQTSDYGIRFFLDKDWLTRLGVLTGEIVHNLRSALDHLADVLVRSNSGTPCDSTQFPIWLSLTGKKGGPKTLGVDGGVSKQALTLIDCLQPYQSGGQGPDNPLAVLAQLNNIDKHRNILVTGGFFAAEHAYMEWNNRSVLSILGGMRFEDGTFVGYWGIIQEGEPPYREEKVDMQVGGSVSIELHDGVWAGKELTRALRELLFAVKSVLVLFAALEV